MKKIVLLSGLFIITALSLTGCFSKKTNESEPAENNQADQTQEEVLGTRLMSINDLLKEGKPLECTWIQAKENGEIDGLIHVDGQRFRNDVTMDLGADSPMPTLESHVLSDGTWLYTWNSNQAGKGTKLEIAKLEKVEVEGDNKNESVNLEEKLEFICKNWSVDENVLTVPGDIEFTDDTAKTNEMIKNNPVDLKKTNEQICSLCAKAPTAEAKANCLKGIKCD